MRENNEASPNVLYSKYRSFGLFIDALLMRRYHFQITCCAPMYIAILQ